MISEAKKSSPNGDIQQQSTNSGQRSGEGLVSEVTKGLAKTIIYFFAWLPNCFQFQVIRIIYHSLILHAKKSNKRKEPYNGSYDNILFYKKERKTGQASSMIPSARPVAISIINWNYILLFEILKSGDRRTDKDVLNHKINDNSSDFGSAEWIKKKFLRELKAFCLYEFLHDLVFGQEAGNRSRMVNAVLFRFLHEWDASQQARNIIPIATKKTSLTQLVMERQGRN